MKNHLFIAMLLVSACADQPDVVADKQAGTSGKIDDPLHTTPSGSYKFEPTLNGAPDTGEITSLSLTASKTFQLTMSDEWSGTTTHTGTYGLYRKSDDTTFYIDFTEGTHTTRYEYSIDVVDDTTLWLHPVQGAARWYGLSHVGADCSTAGCPSGQSCTSCWGENVCMPNGASC